MSLEPKPWPDEDAISLKSPLATLIAKRGPGLVWAVSVTDKRQLVESTRGQLWAVWTGQYSSYLFTVSRNQVIDELE